MAGSQISSTTTKCASSPQVISCLDYGPGRSRSAVQEGSAATTTSWSKGFGFSSILGGAIHAYSDDWEAENRLSRCL